MAINPALIPKELTEVYAPEGHDPNSCIVACNFPTGTTVEECSNFISWVGPVVFVEGAKSIQREANFVVVFSSPESVVKALQENLIYNEGSRIYCRVVDERPNIWTSISGFIQGIDQQYGASDQISNFINQTAVPAFYSTTDQVNEGIQNIMSSDISNKMAEGLANLSNQIKESVSSATNALYSPF